MDIRILDNPRRKGKVLLQVLPQLGVPAEMHWFKFDGASHPITRFRFAPPYETIEAAAYHDYDYRAASAGKTRKEADVDFRKRLMKKGWKVRAYLWWIVVRTIGWLYYRYPHGTAMYNVQKTLRSLGILGCFCL